MRATELLLGIVVPGVPALQYQNASSVGDLSGQLATACNGINAGTAVVEALTEALPILVGIETELGSLDLGACQKRSPLTTKSVLPPSF